jgi:hypothetical protein
VETSNLEAFVKKVLISTGKDKDAPESVKWLWTAKSTNLRRVDEAPKDSKSKGKASALEKSIRLGKEKESTPERERENSRAERKLGDEEDGDIFGTVISRGTGKMQKKSQTLVDGIAGWAGCVISHSSSFAK